MITPLRKLQYSEISKLSLNGNIIDLGGSRRSGYHGLIKGKNKITLGNLAELEKNDIFLDLEKAFPIKDDKYDNILCVNTMEHIFNYSNLLSESLRILKPGGSMIITVPFIFRIHYSPDDYFRYTESSLRTLCKKHQFELKYFRSLGSGPFTAAYQMLYGIIPFAFLNDIVSNFCTLCDHFLSKISVRFRKITVLYPIGYFLILTKPKVSSQNKNRQ